MDGYLWFVLAVSLVVLAVTVWAAIDAFTHGHPGWGAGVLVGLVFGVGWIVAAVYLLTVRRRRTAHARSSATRTAPGAPVDGPRTREREHL